MDDQQRPPRDADSSRSPSAQVSGSSGGIIDWNRAREATAGDEELLMDVIEAFREEAPVLLANLREAMATRDAELMHRMSHTIKNAFYSLGASTAGDIAYKLEQAGGAGDFQPPAELWEALESQYQQVSEELEHFLLERRGDGES